MTPNFQSLKKIRIPDLVSIICCFNVLTYSTVDESSVIIMLHAVLYIHLYNAYVSVSTYARCQHGSWKFLLLQPSCGGHLSFINNIKSFLLLWL